MDFPAMPLSPRSTRRSTSTLSLPKSAFGGERQRRNCQPPAARCSFRSAGFSSSFSQRHAYVPCCEPTERIRRSRCVAASMRSYGGSHRGCPRLHRTQRDILCESTTCEDVVCRRGYKKGWSQRLSLSQRFCCEKTAVLPQRILRCLGSRVLPSEAGARRGAELVPSSKSGVLISSTTC